LTFVTRQYTAAALTASFTDRVNLYRLISFS